PDRTEPPTHLGHRITEGRDVAEITRQEQRALTARRADRVLQARGRGTVDVDEGDLRALRAEGLDDGRADAAGAAGPPDNAIAQAGVRGVRHGLLLGRRVRCGITASR